MLQVITPNPHYANVFSTASKQVEKVEHLDNGLREKPKWLHKPTKKQVEDTEVNGQKVDCKV